MAFFFVTPALAVGLQDFRGKVEHTTEPVSVYNPVIFAFSYELKPSGSSKLELRTRRIVANAPAGTPNPPSTFKTKYDLTKAIVGRVERVSSATSIFSTTNCKYTITKASLTDGVLQLTNYTIYENGCPSQRKVLDKFNLRASIPDGLVGVSKYIDEFHIDAGTLRFGAPAEQAEVGPLGNTTSVNETDRNLPDEAGGTTTTPSRSRTGVTGR